MQVYQTILIDDEMPARMRLRHMLSDHPQIKIIAEADNGISAVELVNQHKPDLIFLDIRMPGLDGFEVVQNLEHTPFIIFCTAYDEYALQAFETKSIDYLVKPVRPERLKKSLTKLQAFSPILDSNELNVLVQEMMKNQPKKEVTTLPIKKNQSVILLKVKEIIYFKASEKYVEVYTRNGEKHLTEQSLINLEQTLPDSFFRIHRSIIINTNEILEVKKYLGGRFIFVMEDVSRSEVISSRSYTNEIKTTILKD